MEPNVGVQSFATERIFLGRTIVVRRFCMAKGHVAILLSRIRSVATKGSLSKEAVVRDRDTPPYWSLLPTEEI